MKHVAELYVDVDILYRKYNFKVVCFYNSFMHIISYQYSFVVQKLFFFTSTTIPVHFRWNVSLIIHPSVFSGFPYYSCCVYTVTSLFCVLSLDVAACHMNCNVLVAPL